MLADGSSRLTAQVNYGLSVSNFGGINAVQLNPTAPVNSKVFLDFNFFASGFSVSNNFAFIHKDDVNLRGMIMNNPVFPSSETRGEGIDYTTDIEVVNAFIRTELNGPSFSMSFGNQSAGFFSRVVLANSVRRLPVDIAVLMFEGLDYEPLQDTAITGDDFYAGAMGWAEFGLNYAVVFKQDFLSNWSAGANVRRLIGHSGTYLSARNVDFTLGADRNLDIRNLDAGYGFAVPVDYNTNEYPGPDPLFKGRGVAMDIGISYRRNREMKLLSDPAKYCQYSYQPYLYKIGISLLDIGSISFKNQAQEHDFDNVSANWQRVDTTDFNSLNEFTQQLSNVFYGNPETSLVGMDNMRINLSTALSLQADYQYYPDWYLTGVLVLPVKTGNYQVHRPAHAYLGLRYETDRYEVNLPVSFYNFEKLRVGLYGRYSYFSIGTDNLASFFAANDLYALDFYFSIKFHLQKGYCNSYKSTKDCRNLSF